MRPRLSMLLICLFVLAAVAHAAPDRDCLYQVSTLDALLAGVFDRATSIGSLLQHGDLGLGCFEAVDGEMVVLDGKAWQVRSDGSIRRATPNMGTPFATVTFFDRDRELKLTQPLDLKALTALLDAQLPTRNLFTVIRLDGDFEFIKTRSVPRQHKPYPRLLDVSLKQAMWEHQGSQGTLIGFFCPYFTAGANMAGWHFHYLSGDRKAGGHVLDLRLTTGTLALDTTPRYSLNLPESGAFTEVKIDKTDKAEMEKIEKDRK